MAAEPQPTPQEPGGHQHGATSFGTLDRRKAIGLIVGGVVLLVAAVVWSRLVPQNGHAQDKDNAKDDRG